MNAIPPALQTSLALAFAKLGDRSPVKEARLLGGGCINHAMHLRTESSNYLLKWNSNSLPGMFDCEAYGLNLIRETHTIRAPEVFTFSESTSGGCPAFILLEWIQPPAHATGLGDEAVLGEQLAHLHHAGVSPIAPQSYGLDQNNYIGSTPQANRWEPDWVVFFREERLQRQVDLALYNMRLPADRLHRLEKLIANLEHWLGGVSRQPSLLHGDLWSGNVIPGPGNEPVLIDPAVYYGDREAEIAYTELFGGFSERFYQAYSFHWPMDTGYRDRRDLYNLYHLLNHLNLFGERYGAHVDAILRYYSG